MIEINAKETIVEEFWDPNLSDAETYIVSGATDRNLRIAQRWAWLECIWSAGKAGSIGRIQREVRWDATQYNEIIVAASLPNDVSMELVLQEGAVEHRIEVERGINDLHEHRGDIGSLGFVDGFGVEWFTEIERQGGAVLLWVALGRDGPSREAFGFPRCRDARKYLSKYLRPIDEVGSVSPTKGYLFTDSDVKRMRRSAGHGELGKVMEVHRRNADALMRTDVGELIKEHVWLSGRAPDFARSRDKNQVDLRKACQTLAFVAMIDSDPSAASKACEFALALASCRTWRESFIADYPFSSWAHAAFTEALCIEAICLTVDWAGEALTPRGEKFLAESVYDKGIGRVERQFMRRFYRVTNPGLVFFPALIMGGLLVSEHFRYYSPRVREHFRLFTKVLRGTMLSDGGTNRPPLYWNKLLGPSLVVQRVSETWAVHRTPVYLEIVAKRLRSLLGKWYWPLGSMALRSLGVVAPSIVKVVLFPRRRKPLKYCGAFARSLGAMLSDSSTVPQLLPVGDRTTSSVLPEAVLLLNLSADTKHQAFWKGLANRFLVEHGKVIEQSVLCTAYLLASGQDVLLPGAESGERDRLIHMKKSGYFSARRRLGRMRTLFVMIGLPRHSCHRHSDVGSFLLQVGGQDVFIDRGSLGYGDPRNSYIKAAQCHNVVTPCGREYSPMLEQHMTDAAVPLKVKQRRNQFVCSGEFGQLWPQEFRVYRRRVESERPDLLVISEYVECLSEATIVSHLQTPLSCRLRGVEVTLEGEGFEVQVVAKQGVETIYIDADSIEENFREINHLRLVSPIARVHHMVVEVRVVTR